MKKLKLNKQTIANLDNPNKILGGGVAATWSQDGEGYQIRTCREKTCDVLAETCNHCNNPDTNAFNAC